MFPLLFWIFAGILPVILYSILFAFLYRAWIKKSDQVIPTSDLPFISVIIPFRNEKENLPVLISALLNQKYPAGNFEIIAVDDHSSDNTTTLVSELAFKTDNFKIVNTIGQGKKAALKTGIEIARGSLIATIDADCLPSPEWLYSIANAYAPNKPSMLIGPVKMISSESRLGQFQSMDYMALQLTGAAAAIIDKPVYCSGANLVFKKDTWQAAQVNLRGARHASGDDVFLLHAIMKMGLRVEFIKDKNALVSTKPEVSVMDFIKQRMRWGGKSISYNEKSSLELALLVFATNFSITITLLLSSFWPSLIFVFIAQLFIKSISDYIFLWSGSSFFDQAISPFRFILFSLIYPLYLSLVAIGGLIFTPSWKTRK